MQMRRRVRRFQQRGLELLGSSRFPLIAALLIGVPPLLAMMIWSRLKARDPVYAKTVPATQRLRREVHKGPRLRRHVAATVRDQLYRQRRKD